MAGWGWPVASGAAVLTTEPPELAASRASRRRFSAPSAGEVESRAAAIAAAGMRARAFIEARTVGVRATNPYGTSVHPAIGASLRPSGLPVRAPPRRSHPRVARDRA